MIPSRLILPVVIALGVIAAGGFFAYRLMDQGAENERARQEKSNAQFTVRANKGAVDFDTCDAADGLYNFRRRTCKLPAT